MTGFDQWGNDNENFRVLDNNPKGVDALIWKTKVIPNSSGVYNGGWYGDFIDIDPNKTYRFTVWMKKLNSDGGTSYFGFRALNSDGTPGSLRLSSSPVLDNNPYFFKSDLPELNKWYLIVGFVNKHSHTDITTLGAIYDSNGIKVLDGYRDYKFASTATKAQHRSFLVYDDTAGDELHLYDPTFYEVNNEMPSITELISSISGNTSGGEDISDDGDTSGGGDTETTGGHFTKTGSNIHFSTGNVGIGTTAISDYKLAVDGKIRSREVKVDNDSWADYVFFKDYKLPTLKEVEQHIQDKGHLINIPSAAEVEANGIELGDMNRLLLEKIEELTLYTLQQQNEINDLKKLILKKKQ